MQRRDVCELAFAHVALSSGVLDACHVDIDVDAIEQQRTTANRL